MKKPKIIAYIIILIFTVCVGIALAADSVGIDNSIRDSETGAPVKFRLRDNHDGTKSLEVYSVTHTPTPSATSTATFTPTPTPTAP